MATTRLPLRVRAALALLAVVAIVVVGGATAAVQYGESALAAGGGFTVSGPWRPGDRWAGIELENRSGTPLTLRSVQARGAENIEVLESRVIGPTASHILLSSSPLAAEDQAAVDDSRPVDGFVLPPHSRDTYQVVIRFRPRATGQAVLSRAAIVYSVWGLDHGSISDGVYCVRAPGARTCSVE